MVSSLLVLLVSDSKPVILLGQRQRLRPTLCLVMEMLEKTVDKIRSDERHCVSCVCHSVLKGLTPSNRRVARQVKISVAVPLFTQRCLFLLALTLGRAHLKKYQTLCFIACYQCVFGPPKTFINTSAPEVSGRHLL